MGANFESDFKGLADPIKEKNKWGFIVDIASFQLAQKLSNLVMFLATQKCPQSLLKIIL